MAEASASKNKQAKKGFLDLPLALRLPIYDQVLVRKNATLSITEGRSGVNPSNLGIDFVLSSRTHYPRAHYLDNPCRWTRSTEDIPSSGILSTCQTIAAEATPMLYCNNSFHFSLNALEPQDPPDAMSSLRASCAKIFDYDPDDWASTECSIRFSTFAAFLNIIGPANAASMTSVSFYGSDADRVACCLPGITELVVLHLPRLQNLKIFVGGRHIDPDEGTPEWFHPNRNSPFYTFRRQGALGPMGRALEGFVDRVTWLKEFKYEGQMVFQYYHGDNDSGEERGPWQLDDRRSWEVFQDRGGWRKVKGLEEVVRKRVAGE